MQVRWVDVYTQRQRDRQRDGQRQTMREKKLACCKAIDVYLSIHTPPLHNEVSVSVYPFNPSASTDDNKIIHSDGPVLYSGTL